MRRVILILFVMLSFGLVTVSAVGVYARGVPQATASATVDVPRPTLPPSTAAPAALVVITLLTLALRRPDTSARVRPFDSYRSRARRWSVEVVAPLAPPDPTLA